VTWFLACAEFDAPVDTCDPREMASGEARAKRVACEDELVPGGEGREGDWLIENAVARFVVRDGYASLTQIGEVGGTLVDAAVPGGIDLLMELLPSAARDGIEAVTGQGYAELRAGDLVYHLDADRPYLHVGTPGLVDGWLVPRPGAERAGLAMRYDTSFLALDADTVAGDDSRSPTAPGQIAVTGLRGVALDPSALWTEPLEIDAPGLDSVAVRVGGRLVDRVPVVDGVATSSAPVEATLAGEAAGCDIHGLDIVACASLRVEAVDEDGRPLPVTVRFRSAEFPLPEGGGAAPLGTTAGEVGIWAGPAYSAWAGHYAGRDTDVAVTLSRALPAAVDWPAPGALFPSGGLVLASLAAEAAPDADHGRYSRDLYHALYAQGFGAAVVIADGELPVHSRDPHDRVEVQLGSRAGGDTWAWPYSSSTKRAGHGASDVQGFGALDRMALVRGGSSTDRYTIVTPSWVAAALAEAEPWAWAPRPDAIWLDHAADVDVYAQLLDLWLDIAPVGPATWVRYLGAPGDVAYEAGLRERQHAAGNGPYVALAIDESEGGDPLPARLRIDVAAPGWMGLDSVSLVTSEGTERHAVPRSGYLVVPAPRAHWAFARVDGACADPGCGEAAWAVSPPVWLDPPG